MPVSVQITGLERVQKTLHLYQEGAAAAARSTFVISSPLSYAFWIEEGYYASGRPGRVRSGGAHMFRRGLEYARQHAPAAVAKALPKGGAAVQDALTGVARQTTEIVRAVTPVRSGNLRASIHTRTV